MTSLSQEQILLRCRHLHRFRIPCIYLCQSQGKASFAPYFLLLSDSPLLLNCFFSLLLFFFLLLRLSLGLFLLFGLLLFLFILCFCFFLFLCSLFNLLFSPWLFCLLCSRLCFCCSFFLFLFHKREHPYL